MFSFRKSLTALVLLLLALFTTTARAARPDDEAALRDILTRFFNGYVNKNLEDALSLWSAGSPELEARRKAMTKTFAESQKIELARLEVFDVKVTGDEARVELGVNLNVADGQTPRPLDEYRKPNRNFYFVREAGQWKLWRSVLAEEELAVEVFKLKTDQEREALLERNKRLANKDLRYELSKQSIGFYDKEEYERALEAFRFTLKFSERIGSKLGVALTWSNMAVVYFEQGNYPLSLEADMKSLALLDGVDNNKRLIGASLNAIGSNYREMGNNALALEYYQKSLKIKEEVALADPKDRPLLQTTYYNIGQIYADQGSPQLALDYYGRALKTALEAGDKRFYGLTLGSTGSVYLRQRDFPKALEFYQKSLDVLRSIGNKKETAQTLHNMGEAYYLQGDNEKALEYYRQSLEIQKAVGSQGSVATGLSRIADVLVGRGEYAQALSAAEESLAIAKKFSIADTAASVLTTAGNANRGLKRFDVAERLYREAIDATEGLRSKVAGDVTARQRFFERKLEPYRNLVELLISQGKTPEALAVAERTKGRVLLDVLSGGRVNVTKAMTAREREEEQRLRVALFTVNSQVTRENGKREPDKARLAELGTRLQEARLRMEEFESGLYAAHPELKVQRGEAPPLRAEQAASLLADDTGALLEYVVSEGGAYLFVMTREKGQGARPNLQAYRLAAGGDKLNASAERLRQLIARRDPAFRREARELYDLLLGPALKQLAGVKSLVIVPDGALWNLPFQALQTAGDRFLVEEYAVSYAPSLSVLAEMTKARGRQAGGAAGGTPNILALGNPSVGERALQRAASGLMDEELGPLPDAERQVNGLREIYGPARSKVYVGAGASEERVKAEASSYRVLQLAAHGILNDSDPMYSHIVLSQVGGQNEDGLLEAWEMMNLDLKTDMVVLSACETARGRVGAGEGVIGMTWALFIAGSPTTVVSQWKVDAASTTDLMLEFHRQITSAPRLTRAEALRRAAVKLMKTADYRHPFYWAGFVVIGDAR